MTTAPQHAPGVRDRDLMERLITAAHLSDRPLSQQEVDALLEVSPEHPGTSV